MNNTHHKSAVTAEDRHRAWAGTKEAAHPKPASTPEDMRSAIDDLAIESPLVNTITKIADMLRLTPEDRYTMLAYHALATLARSQEAHIDAATHRRP